MPDHDTIKHDEGLWDEHRLAELARWLKATPAQRLTWLEHALRLAHQRGALPKADRRPAAPRR